MPVTRIDDRPGPSDLDAPQGVSLAIAEPIAIKDALLLLVRGTPFSIVLGDNVDGTFAGELKDLSLRQAMDAVLHPRGLEYTLDGRLISVHRRKPAMRMFDVSYLNVRREAQRAIPGTFTSSTGTNYFDEIERGVSSLLSPEGRAHVDRRSGLVQVHDFQDRLDRVATYLETVHVRALRQVRLSARVVEVTLADPSVQAVDWRAVALRSGEPWDGTNATAGIQVRDFAAVLGALAAQGTVRTLASPHVLAMNDEPAVMRVGSEADGFTLTVTPHIDAGGMVQLSVAPAFAENARVAEMDSVMRIRDGESILLSGMLQRRDTVRTELVILLNATIAR